MRQVEVYFYAMAAAATICLTQPANGDEKTEANFYKGRNVSVFIGFGPGGGYDLSARTLARHMGRHISGEPTLIPRNMPGAGSMQLANYLYNVSPKDGSEFGTFARTIPLEPLIGKTSVNFDPRRFTWLGSSSNEVSTCVSWHTSSVATFEDLRKQELTVGASGPASPSASIPNVLNAVLGTRIKVITGYTGSATVLTAMESGEVSGFCSWGWMAIMAQRPAWVRDKKINVLVQLGLRKHLEHPEVPLATDFARSDEERKVLEFVFAPQMFARPFAAPPNLSQERAATLRNAFAATLQDPIFVTEAEKLGLEPELVSWQDIQSLINSFFEAPPAVIAKVRDAMEAR